VGFRVLRPGIAGPARGGSSMDHDRDEISRARGGRRSGPAGTSARTTPDSRTRRGRRTSRSARSPPTTGPHRTFSRQESYRPSVRRA
jgi:hypothetical protein